LDEARRFLRYVIPGSVFADLEILPANSRAETLANLVHSVGAANVATWFACIATILIAFEVGRPPVGRLIAPSLFAGILVWAHWRSYRDLINISDRFVEQVISDALLRGANPTINTFTVGDQ
jgi:hypothetical protein